MVGSSKNNPPIETEQVAGQTEPLDLSINTGMPPVPTHLAYVNSKTDVHQSPSLLNPETLDAFEKHDPGAVKAIREQFEADSAHTRAFDDKWLETTAAERTRGQWISAALVGALVLAGLVCALTGHDQVASDIFKYGIAAVVSFHLINVFKNRK